MKEHGDGNNSLNLKVILSLKDTFLFGATVPEEKVPLTSDWVVLLFRVTTRLSRGSSGLTVEVKSSRVYSKLNSPLSITTSMKKGIFTVSVETSSGWSPFFLVFGQRRTGRGLNNNYRVIISEACSKVYSESQESVPKEN